MTLNRNSIKWLPKVSLVVGLVVLAIIVTVKASAVHPEFEVFNTLEAVNSIKLTLKGLLF
ncbi:MAG: hypothetical protein HWD86_07760 [Kangiellaceae bacterium]|nr:hypothetical protein [Kangiellaceae bacterium]